MSDSLISFPRKKSTYITICITQINAECILYSNEAFINHPGKKNVDLIPNRSSWNRVPRTLSKTSISFWIVSSAKCWKSSTRSNWISCRKKRAIYIISSPIYPAHTAHIYTIYQPYRSRIYSIYIREFPLSQQYTSRGNFLYLPWAYRCSSWRRRSCPRRGRSDRQRPRRSHRPLRSREWSRVRLLSPKLTKPQNFRVYSFSFFLGMEYFLDWWFANKYIAEILRARYIELQESRCVLYAFSGQDESWLMHVWCIQSAKEQAGNFIVQKYRGYFTRAVKLEYYL